MPIGDFIRDACGAVKDKLTEHFEPKYHARQQEKGGQGRGRARSHSRTRSMTGRVHRTEPQTGPSRQDRAKGDFDHVYDETSRRKTDPETRDRDKSRGIEVAGFRLSIERPKIKKRHPRSSREQLHDRSQSHRHHRDGSRERSPRSEGDHKRDGSLHHHHRRRREYFHPKAESCDSNKRINEVGKSAPPVPVRPPVPLIPTQFVAEARRQPRQSDQDRLVYAPKPGNRSNDREAKKQADPERRVKREDAERLRRWDEQHRAEQAQREKYKAEERARALKSPKAKPNLPPDLNAENLKGNTAGYVEGGQPSSLNRQLGDMTRTYLEGMVPE